MVTCFPTEKHGKQSKSNLAVQTWWALLQPGDQGWRHQWQSMLITWAIGISHCDLFPKPITPIRPRETSGKINCRIFYTMHVQDSSVLARSSETMEVWETVIAQWETKETWRINGKWCLGWFSGQKKKKKKTLGKTNLIWVKSLPHTMAMLAC
jgi:hypothetical protein